MGHKERDLINIRLSNLKENERLFRINSGMGWSGKITHKGEFTIIKNARPFHGAPEGFGDLVGWTSIIITPDLIGKTLAIFTMEEVKATGKLSAAQERFKEIIERMGGLFRTVK